MRSPPSGLSEMILRPSFFLSAPESAPRTVWGCQRNALLSWAIVAPSGRCSNSMSFCCFVAPPFFQGGDRGRGLGFRGRFLTLRHEVSAFCRLVAGSAHGRSSRRELPAEAASSDCCFAVHRITRLLRPVLTARPACRDCSDNESCAVRTAPGSARRRRAARRAGSPETDR
jgi:hypothetical protein